MNSIPSEYFDILIERLYRMYGLALGKLTAEQWHYIPGGQGNSIAFIAFHYFRTEDNIIRWILQNRRPTVWMEGGWAEKLGLPPVTQGTSMPVAEAHSLRIEDTTGFLEYVQQVRASTEEFLHTWEEPDFDTMITLKPVGEMSKLRLLAQQAFPHGYAHLGEIQHLRAVQGLAGIGL